ncbi:MAG: MauE/DoxX family redox-associated membrane protein [Acidobacteriota bacterium]
MDASTTAPSLPRQLELPAWKSLASHAGAIFIAGVFLLAGIYKAIDPYKFAALAHNLLVPYSFTLPLALTLAVLETTTGILVLIPRFRRWGAYLGGALLLGFMGYVAWNYTALQGRDCSCFPELKLPFGFAIDLKRKVGPGFFYGDALFIAAAAMAGLWAKRSYGKRSAAVVLGAVAVFTAVSYGVAFANRSGIKAPDSITVDGQFLSLQEGREFLYFFDPQCGTCFAVGKSMGPLKFQKDVVVIGIPTRVPEGAPDYLTETGLKAKLSPDVAKLRETFKFEYPPYAVLIERGYQTKVISLSEFDEEHPENHIKLMHDMGVIE